MDSWAALLQEHAAAFSSTFQYVNFADNSTVTSESDAGSLEPLHLNFIVLLALRPEDSLVLELAEKLRSVTEDPMNLFTSLVGDRDLSAELFCNVLQAARIPEAEAMRAWRYLQNDLPAMTRATWEAFAVPHMQCAVKKAAMTESNDLSSSMISAVPRGEVVKCLGRAEPLQGRLVQKVAFDSYEGFVNREHFRDFYPHMMPPEVSALYESIADMPAEEVRRLTAQEDEAIDAELGVKHEDQVAEVETGKSRKRAANRLQDYFAASAKKRARRLPVDTAASSSAPSAPSDAKNAKTTKNKRNQHGLCEQGPRVDKVQREIARLQSRSAPTTLIPKVAFARLVRDITEGIKPDLRISTSAFQLLQESAEWVTADTLAAANKLAVHAKRSTVMSKDLAMLRWIREHPSLG